MNGDVGDEDDVGDDDVDDDNDDNVDDDNVDDTLQLKVFKRIQVWAELLKFWPPRLVVRVRVQDNLNKS